MPPKKRPRVQWEAADERDADEPGGVNDALSDASQSTLYSSNYSSDAEDVGDGDMTQIDQDDPNALEKLREKIANLDDGNAKLQTKIDDHVATIRQLKEVLWKYHNISRNIHQIAYYEKQITSECAKMTREQLRIQEEFDGYLFGNKVAPRNDIDVLVDLLKGKPAILFVRLCEYLKGRQYCISHFFRKPPRFDEDIVFDILDFIKRSIPGEANEAQWKHTYATWQTYNWRGRDRPTKAVRVLIKEEMERRERTAAELHANNLPGDTS